MKTDTHPKYEATTFNCSCGNVITVRSTRGGEMHLDVCSNCHPFYSGKQKIMDAGGRLNRFKKKYQDKATDTTETA